MRLVKGVVSVLPMLTVSETALYFTNGIVGNDTFDIVSNGSWVITDDMIWCSVDDNNGSGNQTIIVTVGAGTDRGGIITVQGQGITRYISVSQGTPP
jgi:hypothetical protein